MRVRTRKKLKKKNTVIVLLFLLPLIGFGSYAAGLLIIINDMASYTFKIGPPDTTYFYSLDSINSTHLSRMASLLDTRNELYHLEDNLSTSCSFTNYSYTEVSKWHETDNAGLWGGQMLGAQCMRYATAKKENNQAEMTDSIRVIKKLVTGFSMMMAIPNGGLGPDYPGTPARFYAAPGTETKWPEMWSSHYKMFYGQGIYSEYRCRLYTSKDELGGYYFGLGSVLKFVSAADSPSASWCYETVRLIVAQLIEGFKQTNWLLLHGDGTPDGVDLNPYFGGGSWQLTLLKMGMIAYPEQYTNLYYYYAAKARNMHTAGEGSLWNTIMEYYAYNFGQCVSLILITLEDDPNLKMFYINLYESGFYDVLRYHRNAWINSAHLAIMNQLTPTVREQFNNLTYPYASVRHDVLDQLYRYKDWINPTGMSLSPDTWGERNYNLTQRPHSTRATSTDLRIQAQERDPSAKKWLDFMANDTFGKLYAWIGEDLFDFDDHYLLPRTVSEAGIASVVWAGNPFYSNGGNPTGNGLHEERGLSFLLPYWIGRYYGFVPGPI